MNNSAETLWIGQVIECSKKNMVLTCLGQTAGEVMAILCRLHQEELLKMI